MCAKLRTAAASNNRDHALQSLFAYACLYVQSFSSQYQQSFHVAISLTIACSRYVYNGFILHAHPVRGESHNQRNTTGEVATRDRLNEREENNRRNGHGVDERTDRQSSHPRSLLKATRTFPALIADVIKAITERSPC